MTGPVSPPDAPELPGLVFAGVLGSGGYSDVYLYEQQMPRRRVAVKVLRAPSLTPALRTQFAAEANAMAELADHPNIVPVFSADVTADGRPYLVMMYYPRPNLGRRAATERLDVAETVRIGIQIASAVETAHRAGILHRDVKPANVLTSQYGAPGLTDFGIAAQVGVIDSGDDVGVSVPWSPPEVLYATANTSVRSDVYSLAATLWHLLVGRSPYTVPGGDNTPFAMMRRVRDAPVPSTGRADVPTSLERLLRQALAKDPAQRPASAIEFARGLQAIEQELRLPRTEIVVLTEFADEPAAAAGDDPGRTGARAGRTRTKGIPSVTFAQSAPPAPVEPAARPDSWSGYPEADRSVGVSHDPDEQTRSGRPVADAAPARADRADPQEVGRPTVQRPVGPRDAPGPVPAVPSGPAHSAPEPPRPPRRPARRGWLVTAAVVVVAAAVAVGVVVTSGGHSSTPRANDPTAAPTIGSVDSSQDAGVVGQDLPPGAPTITAKALAQDRVQFTWTYSQAEASDTFLWRLADNTARTGATTRPTLTLRRSAPTQTLCLQIKIVRADGSNGSTDWSRAGCSP